MNAFLIIVIAIIVLGFILYYLLIGNIDRSEPEIVKLDDPIKLIGTEINTNDRDIYKDVGVVASRFNEIKKNHPIPNLKQPWATINISMDYNRDTLTFKYIMGDVVTEVDAIPDGLKSYEVPALTYAIFPIRPKSRFAWGITMGRMKRFIFTEWLPASGYESSDIIGDFELHDERSLGKRPEIHLYVALKEKEENNLTDR